MVNAHHGADRLIAHLAGRPGVEVVHEPDLLGTGGGLVNAARLGLLGADDDPVLVTAADHVVDPADLAGLAAFLDRCGAPMAAGLVPAADDPFGLPSPGAGGPRPRRPLGLGRAYAVRAGLLAGLEPGPASLVARVLGPLLERGELAGRAFRGPLADAGTLARLLDVSAGLPRRPLALRPAPGPDVPGGRARAGARRRRGRGRPGGRAGRAGAAGRRRPGRSRGRGDQGRGRLRGGGRPRRRVVGSFLGPGAQLPPGTTATAALLPGPPARRTERGNDPAR